MTTDRTETEAHVDALRSSVARLRDLASTIDADQLAGRAYPTEWSVADVLSHIGSGAVIMQRRLEDSLAHLATPDDFAPPIWETWNAKDPAAKRDDALTADAELLARIDAVTAAERRGFTLVMGPLSFGFDQFVDLRLNEHSFHTWDIEVARDPAARIPPMPPNSSSTTSNWSPATPPGQPVTRPPSRSPPPTPSAASASNSAQNR